jgi:pimeloyl-ACP methyl ester carboxylesterase
VKGARPIPYATNPVDGVRIYYDVEGSGSPLLFHHGLTESGRVFRNRGLGDFFQARYQQIWIDARGHGRSDKPHTADAYRLSQRALDVVAVLDALEIEQAHFFGYSLGAITGYGLLRDWPDRLRSAILGGGATSVPEERKAGAIERYQRGPHAMLDRIEDSAVELTPEQREHILQIDTAAMIAVISADVFIPDDVFATTRVPCLLWAGEQDHLVRDQLNHIATLIPSVELHVLPELDHAQAITHSDRMLPRVSAFLEFVEAQQPSDP